MHRFRLAVATRCYELPFRQALQQAADSGADGVQFDLRQELNLAEFNASARRDLQHVLEELGVRVAGTTFTLRRALTDEHELDRRIAAIKQAMSWSFELQSRVMTCRIGRLPAQDDDKANAILKDILDDLARHGNHVGVTLAITPMQNSAADLQTLLATIQTGPLGVDFDPAQFAMAGHNPVAALKTLHAFAHHVILRDGLSELDGTTAEAAVGEGSVPWIELLATLGEIEYDGWLTAVRTQGSDKAGDIASAIGYIKRLLLGG